MLLTGKILEDAAPTADVPSTKAIAVDDRPGRIEGNLGRLPQHTEGG